MEKEKRGGWRSAALVVQSGFAAGNLHRKYAICTEIKDLRGLAASIFCAMILSTEEQSSRRREQNTAVRRSGNAAQEAHGKPGVSGGSRATGKLQDGGEDAHAHDGLTGAFGSAGATSQARVKPAATGRDQVAEARSSISRKKGREPERELAPSAFSGGQVKFLTPRDIAGNSAGPS